MKWIKSYEEWLGVVQEQQSLLLFVKTNNCSVCESLLQQIVVLHEDYPLPFYLVNVAEVPEVAGQLSVLSAPVVLLFNEGTEYARFARFVRMDELKRRMQELLERGKVID